MIPILTLPLLPRPALPAAACTGPLTGALVLSDGPAVYRPHHPERTEHIARYLTRPPVRLDALQEFTDHQITVTTPPDPKTGATSRTLDVLDWIHAITNQIPDRGQHLTRYYGWYACRTRGAAKARTSPTTTPTDTPAEDEGEPAFTTARRASWARLLRKLLEVDPSSVLAVATHWRSSP